MGTGPAPGPEKQLAAGTLRVAWVPCLNRAWLVCDETGAVAAVPNLPASWPYRLPYRGPAPTRWLSAELARLVLALLGVPGCEMRSEERKQAEAAAWRVVGQAMVEARREGGVGINPASRRDTSGALGPSGQLPAVRS